MLQFSAVSELQLFFVHQHLIAAAETVYFQCQIEGAVFDYQLAFFDTAHIKDIIDQGQQVHGGAFYDLQVF